MSRDALIAAFESGDASRICTALVSAALHEGDRGWVEPRCRAFLKCSDREVRQVAATCLGHLARLHRDIEDETVVALLKARREEPALGTVEEALSDIEMFTRVPKSR